MYILYNNYIAFAILSIYYIICVKYFHINKVNIILIITINNYIKILLLPKKIILYITNYYF